MKCDVCDKMVEQYDSHLLTTFEVLQSVDYWIIYWNKLVSIDDSTISISSADDVVYYAAKRAANDSPWLVCGSCIYMFSIDQTQTREKAKKWWATKQPSSGMALCKVAGNTISIIDSNKYEIAMGAAAKAYFKKNSTTESCFIATACYGSPECVEVAELRRFRDTTMLRSKTGRLLIRWYYRVSPPLAVHLSRMPTLKYIIKKCLLSPIVRIII